MNRPELLDTLHRAVAADIAPEHVDLLAVDIAPDRHRAGVLVAYAAAPDPYLAQAFLGFDYGEWRSYGEMDGLGPAWWDFGEEMFAVLSGRAEAAQFVEVELDGVVVTRPVTNGYFLAVLWEAGRPSPGTMPAAIAHDGFSQSVRFGGEAQTELPVPRLVAKRPR